MVKKPFTSDGQDRPNVEPMVAPAVPPSYFTIGESARVGVLNDFGRVVNDQLVHWAATTPPCTVIDRSAAYSNNDVVSRVNDIINTMAASCAEFGILTAAGEQMTPYTSLDYNAFTSVMNAIGAQLTAMQQAKP
jgi:hypothetical protein